MSTADRVIDTVRFTKQQEDLEIESSQGDQRALVSLTELKQHMSKVLPGVTDKEEQSALLVIASYPRLRDVLLWLFSYCPTFWYGQNKLMSTHVKVLSLPKYLTVSFLHSH